MTAYLILFPGGKLLPTPKHFKIKNLNAGLSYLGNLNLLLVT